MPLELPAEFKNEIRSILGSEAGALFEALNGEECASLRLNKLRQGAKAAAEPYMLEQVPWEADGYYTRPGARPGAGLAHAGGAFYIQDASAMAPVAVMNPLPGEVILDMCAAPGGKSSQIAARLGGTGALVANEIVENRALVLRSNLERLGVANARVTNAPPERFAEPLFDAVLVDAPCSGEGMFRRDKSALEEWYPEAPQKCALRQAQILDCAARALKPGGRLVYSTCTFNRAENERSIEAFLLRHPEFEPWDFALEGVGQSEGGMLRLWPHRIKGEGHFVCRLRRQGALKPNALRAGPPSKAAESALALMLNSLDCRLPEGIVKFENQFLSLLPPALPDAPGARTLACGLSLGRVSKGVFEPAHALAMALAPNMRASTVELEDARAAIYLQGEALPSEGAPGWTLVLWRDLPLGWGKRSNGVLKNHLPKGLRLRGGHALKV